jgi:NADPH:quinone reductase-like Zn-dependent oxidoreductase
MKAAVLHAYGPPSNLKYEDFPDPKPGEGEVLVRVSAASINPIDLKMRSGAAKDRFPVEFPSPIGRDVAGVVREVGEGVTSFTAGDRVMSYADKTYAELCIVKATDLAQIPEGLEITTAGAIPLVSVTGDQLVRIATKAEAGQTILITGVLGSVGRCAVFAAHEIGAKVIAGVRKKQLAEAKALPGVIDAIALDDEESLASLGLVDGIADTVGGATATKLLSKVKPGGAFGSVLGPPKDAALHPTVNVTAITAHPDAAAFVHYAEAVRDGKLVLPIERMMPLAEAAEAHAILEKGGVLGKIILLA